MYEIKFMKTAKSSTKIDVDTQYSEKIIYHRRTVLFKKIRFRKMVLFLDSNDDIVPMHRMIENKIELSYV